MNKGTTDIGYVNKNGQRVIRKTGEPGTDHNQFVYVLLCGDCDHEYGANGSDIFLRRCPSHDTGAPGIPISSVLSDLELRHYSSASILDILAKLTRRKSFDSVHLLSTGKGYEAVPATDGHHLCNGVVGIHPDCGQIAIFWPQHDGSRLQLFCSKQIESPRS